MVAFAAATAVPRAALTARYSRRCPAAAAARRAPAPARVAKAAAMAAAPAAAPRKRRAQEDAAAPKKAQIEEAGALAVPMDPMETAEPLAAAEAEEESAETPAPRCATPAATDAPAPARRGAATDAVDSAAEALRARVAALEAELAAERDAHGESLQTLDVAQRLLLSYRHDPAPPAPRGDAGAGGAGREAELERRLAEADYERCEWRNHANRMLLRSEIYKAEWALWEPPAAAAGSEHGAAHEGTKIYCCRTLKPT
jgi:hypothetical protein